MIHDFHLSCNATDGTGLVLHKDARSKELTRSSVRWMLPMVICQMDQQVIFTFILATAKLVRLRIPLQGHDYINLQKYAF